MTHYNPYPGHGPYEHTQPSSPPSPPQVVYVQAPAASSNGNGRDISVKNISMPIVLVCVAAAALIGITFTFATNLSEIKSSIARIQDLVTGYVASTNERIGRTENEIERMKQNRWTTKDHDLWCSRAEVANPGWRCMPVTTGSS